MNSILGMLTPAEREYLQKYAANEFTGQGAIVDLGCWLGSSTIPIAEGLKQNPNAQGHKVHAYDIFIWENWMNDLSCVKGTRLEGRFQQGESFLEACFEQTEPWKDQIEFYPADLTQTGWHGGAIEFLFIDAMKTWELANCIVRNFFPFLIPGKSIVVQQDFNHFYTYWIQLIMYRLREYFEAVYDVPGSSSLVFKYVKQIPDDVLQTSLSVKDFSSEEIHAAFDYEAQLVTIEKRPTVLAGKIKAFLEREELNYQPDFTKSLMDIYQAQVEMSHALQAQLRQNKQRLQTSQQRQRQLNTQLKTFQKKLTRRSKLLQIANRHNEQLKNQIADIKQQMLTAQNSKPRKLDLARNWLNIWSFSRKT